MDHHERILTKFVDIVGEIIASLAKTIDEVDWDQGSGSTGTTFITEVIKNTSTMHKVLSAQLPPEQVQEIFSRIFELLNRQVPEYFANVKPTTPAGEQRVLDDVMFLSESLERLRGVKAANLEAHFRGRFRLPRCGAVEAKSSLSCLLYLSAVLYYTALLNSKF